MICHTSLSLQDITNSSTPKPTKPIKPTKPTKRNLKESLVQSPSKKIMLANSTEFYTLDKINITATEKIIKEKLSTNSLITTDSLKISAICPLTKQKMKHPVRFKNCKHIECFDFFPYLETSKKQGFKPSQITVFNATDRDLDNLHDHPGRKVVRNYIRNQNINPKSSFQIREELKQQPVDIRNWISKTKIRVCSCCPGREETKVANLLICPICNDNLLVMSDLVFCEFTKKIIEKYQGENDEIELELRDNEVQIKENRKPGEKPLSKFKFLETDSGNLYPVREEMNSKGPVVCLDSF